MLYCKNCETVIEENFTSPQMESTNNRQTVFVVNRKAVESTNDIQNITFGLKLTRLVKSVMPIMTCFSWYGSPGCCEDLKSLGSKKGLRYLTILSDGDAKIWTRLNEVAPYGKAWRKVRWSAYSY